MIEDGSLWETLRRHVSPDYVVACVQVSYLNFDARYRRDEPALGSADAVLFLFARCGRRTESSLLSAES